MRLFIFGAGYSGRAIAREALAAGATVAGTTRLPEKAEELRAAGIRPLVFDGAALSDELLTELAAATHLIASAAPDPVDPVLAAARGVIVEKMPALRWIGYLSTVGVYGDHGGAWVGEEAPCRPVSRRSQLRVAAEREWLALGREAGIPVALLRLAGIYGPGRNPFLKLAEGSAHRIVKPGQVFNRIHVADIAATLRAAIARPAPRTYNVSDDEPAPPQDVVVHAADLMGVAPPPEVAFAEADLSPMARSFYASNRRISNRRIRDELGVALAYPTYRDGLSALWRGGTWRG